MSAASVHISINPIMVKTLKLLWLQFKEEISTIIVEFYKFSITRIIYVKTIIKFSTALLLLQESDCYTSLFNPPWIASDLRGTHDTSPGALPPLHSVESAHL